MPRGERLRGRGEEAQALIFFAVVVMLLAMTTGLAVEGGRLYTQYRQLQAAADLAASVGAQKLPCNLSDTTCIQAAETLACQAAAQNGFSDCTNGAGPGAFVPPVSCSPYNQLDYGNDNGDTGGNRRCKTTTSPVTFYDYIEVQLTSDLGQIPIFNKAITLSAHAVARHGVPSTKDYAVSQLDPAGQLSVSGSFDYFVNGSTFANGTLSPGATSVGCEGGFFTAQNISDPRTEVTYDGGVAGFAPPACYRSDGVTLQTANTDNWESNLPQISDPYCDSISPPYFTTRGSDCHGRINSAFNYTAMPNCIRCTEYGWYYDITTNTWIQDTASNKDPSFGNSSSDIYEMFPGVYGAFSPGKNTHIYMNPGVYTFTGSVEFDFGSVCTFGAPLCDSGTSGGDCADTSNNGYDSWTPGATQGSSSKGNTWYYHCSPYGFYDTYLKRPASAAGGPATQTCPSDGIADLNVGPTCIAPTYWDTTKTNNFGINNGVGGISAIPLNGVTWQLASTASGAIGGHGSGNSDLAYFVVAPNPCPGTAPASVGVHKVSFNNGYAGAQFDYTSTGIDNPPDSGSQIPMRAGFLPGTYAGGPNGGKYTTSPIVPNWGWETVNGVPTEDLSASQIYPSMDLSIQGECSPDNFEVWPGEMGGTTGQHIHFALFDRQNNLDRFNGNQGQSIFGIVYVPGNGTSGPTYNIRGAGSAAGGLPYIWGQIVAWDIDFGGNGTVDLIYRPCNDKQDPCASGIGTQLVQ